MLVAASSSSTSVPLRGNCSSDEIRVSLRPFRRPFSKSPSTGTPNPTSYAKPVGKSFFHTLQFLSSSFFLSVTFSFASFPFLHTICSVPYHSLSLNAFRSISPNGTEAEPRTRCSRRTLPRTNRLVHLEKSFLCLSFYLSRCLDANENRLIRIKLSYACVYHGHAHEPTERR